MTNTAFSKKKIKAVREYCSVIYVTFILDIS